MDADENAAAGLLYRGFWQDFKAHSPTIGTGGGVDGGDGVKAFQGGSTKSFDATLGGTLNYLTGTYNSTTGGVNVLHA